MVTSEEARTALRTIARLAEEQGNALDKAFRLFGDGALIGPGAERLHDGMLERHHTVQRAFMDAFHETERVARAGGEPPSFAAPYPRPTPAPLSPPRGGYVGGDPALIQALHDELGHTGSIWQETGRDLSGVLSRLGLDSRPGQHIAQAGTWLVDQRTDLRRRRTELLKTPPTPSPAPPADEDAFASVTNALTEAVDWAGDRWADTVQSAANLAGLPQVGKLAHTYVDRLAKPMWQGAAEGGVSLIKQGWQASLGGMVTDWDGYLNRLEGASKAGTFAAQHPLEFLKQASDWKTLTQNPARWFGRLVPDITLAAATAGAGTASTAAARMGTGVVKAAEDAGAAAKAAENLADGLTPGTASRGAAGDPGTTGPSEIRHGPLNPGPLADRDAIATFRSNTYSTVTTTSPTTLYRVYGGTAGELGAYWTRVKPTGPVQAILDSALFAKWGNTATKWVEIRVPPGVTFYEGVAAEQGGLTGGGSQVVITQHVDPDWITDRGEFPAR
ncbi:hypothetical protein HTZ77_37165 [Nonomuraea sp. SMC257]|uniref:Uncharacterized protein n=1 Tax=Nonomuraea montanisoli TaxID=2741721 RepID=A0A7Y6M6J9_9ACTN|nr:hypothetical protein [Nonomuraea montanisoli]NUW36993.1 hypothetical protein [Nonomuraea montanisoli]